MGPRREIQRCAAARSGPAGRLAGLAAAALAIGVIWSPAVARACSVCTAGRDEESRAAFLLTTAFLTFLPLALIGGVICWLRALARRTDAGAGRATREDREPATTRAAAA